MKIRRDASALARLRKHGPGIGMAAGVVAALLWGAVSSGAGHAGRPASAPQAPAQPAPAPEVLSAPVWLQVEADATHTAPADPAALQALLAATPATGAPQPATEAAALQPPPEWLAWGRLASRRARATVRLASARPADRASETLLGVYAAHSAEGTTLCLVNRAGQEARARVRLHLPPGIYRIERLTLSPGSSGDRLPLAAPASRDISPSASAGGAPVDAPQTGAPASSSPAGPTGLPPLRARLERLGGRELPGSGRLTNGVALAPGEICLLRCTDTGREARAALFDALARLHDLALSAPDPARQVRRILEEGESYLGGLYPGAPRTLDRRIGCIHRLLLLTAQARSLQRNAQALGEAPARPGRAAQQALDHLAESLAETSAALLGLTPNVTLTPQESAPDAQARPATLNAQEETAPRVVTLTVSLANTGPQSVSLVKLGLDSAALPSEVTCRPADPAFFDALPPGQT
ncbi:MAG TPA: hypothetical protein VKT32_08380, partial [Chthonomonadaceae bacterium]|nr:hypothetical protein [Chthonomonadaceae bacterium]